MEIFGYVGTFIFVLGIMIFVHELGHHLMAKSLGIGVQVFSLGFGPRLFGFKKGETDYRVSLLPLGGYVRMTGETYDDELEGSSEEFLSRPKTHRFLVAIAGPLMNLVLAVLLLAVNYMGGVPVIVVNEQPAVIGYIEPDSPARAAGLEIGDRIISLGEESVETWQDLQIRQALLGGSTVPVKVVRDGETLSQDVTLEKTSQGEGRLGVFPDAQTVISDVQSDPALSAGLQSGDEILKVQAGGESAEYYSHILSFIAQHGGEPVEFSIRRDGETLTKTITPVEMDGRSRIGIIVEPGYETRVDHYGLFAALGKSIEQNWQFTLLTFDIVGKLLTGQTSLEVMSGPIQIAKISGDAASTSYSMLIGVMALISLQLGIFNLFPIPILDGGIIALLLIEAVIGRDLSMRLKERILQLGFIFLVLLMGIVIFNDIAKMV